MFCTSFKAEVSLTCCGVQLHASFSFTLPFWKLTSTCRTGSGGDLRTIRGSSKTAVIAAILANCSQKVHCDIRRSPKPHFIQFLRTNDILELFCLTFELGWPRAETSQSVYCFPDCHERTADLWTTQALLFSLTVFSLGPGSLCCSYKSGPRLKSTCGKALTEGRTTRCEKEGMNISLFKVPVT